MGEVQRRLLLTAVVAETPLHALQASARFSGFADAIGALADELSAAMAEPEPAAASARAQELTALVAAYRAAVDGLGRHDRPGRRAIAAGAARGPVGRMGRAARARLWVRGHDPRAVLAIRALAARCEVTVSLPYEVDRPAYAAVRPLVEALSQSATLLELPAADHHHAAALTHLGRTLFSDRPPPPAPDADGAVSAARGLRPPRRGRAGGRRGGRPCARRSGPRRDRHHRALGGWPASGAGGGLRGCGRARIDGCARSPAPHRVRRRPPQALRFAWLEVSARALRIPRRPFSGRSLQPPASTTSEDTCAGEGRWPRRGDRGHRRAHAGPGAFPAIDRLAAAETPSLAALVRGWFISARSLAARFVPEQASDPRRQ